MGETNSAPRGRRVRMTTHILLARSRITGARHLRLLYAFMEWCLNIGTAWYYRPTEVKSQVLPVTYMQTQRGGRVYRYSYTASITSAQDGGGCSTSHPGSFSLRKKPRNPLNRRLGGTQGRSGSMEKINSLASTAVQTPNPQVRSKSLYRLRHHGPHSRRTLASPTSFVTSCLSLSLPLFINAFQVGNKLRIISSLEGT
jgi:hypothetical protein